MRRQPVNASELRRDVVLAAIAIHGDEQRLESYSAGIDVLGWRLRRASRRIRNVEHVVDVRILDKFTERLIGSVVRNRQAGASLQDHAVIVGAHYPIRIRTSQPVEIEPQIGRRCAVSFVRDGWRDAEPEGQSAYRRAESSLTDRKLQAHTLVLDRVARHFSPTLLGKAPNAQR